MQKDGRIKTMKALQNFGNQELTWVHLETPKGAFALCTGDEVYATLCWEENGSLLARAESADGTWTFRRIGTYHPRVIVRHAESKKDIATFTSRSMGQGIVEFSDGLRFYWENINFWATQWEWRGSDGQKILSLKPVSVSKSDVRVEVAPGMFSLPKLLLLAALGQYQMKLMAEEIQ